jgi:coenzyme F420 hydrogenase subunit beta
VLGKHIACYSGFAIDQTTRFKAASGGIVTAVLKFLLAKKYIDGAIVAKMNAGNPPLAKSFVANCGHDIDEAMGSKYCPVLLSDALRSIEKGKRYAFVGLPCQIYSVSQLAKSDELVKDSIRIYIGLFCGGTFSYNGISYILDKYGLRDQNIQQFEFRGGGWPGRMLIQTDSDTVAIPFGSYFALVSPWFLQSTCRTCTSGLCPTADITCGDAWLAEVMSTDKVGTSIVVSRTRAGDNILRAATYEHYLALQQIDVRTVLRSQKYMLISKHLSLNVRLDILDFFRKKVYVRHIDMTDNSRITLVSYFGEIALFLGQLLASSRRLWRLFGFYRALYDYADLFYKRAQICRLSK